MILNTVERFSRTLIVVNYILNPEFTRLLCGSVALQTKRSASVVDLRENVGLQVSRRLSSAQLVRTVSLEALDVPALCPDKLFQLTDTSTSPQ